MSMAVTMTTIRRRVIFSHQLFFYATILCVILASTRFSQISGNIINDTNNMLRDATTAETDTDTDTDANMEMDNTERVSNVMSRQMLRNGDSEMKKTKKKRLYLNSNLRNSFNIELERDENRIGIDEDSGEMNNVGDTSSVELLRFVNDEDEVRQRAILTTVPTVNKKRNIDAATDSDTVAAIDVDMVTDTLSLEDQVRLLTKQLNALMTRRREDYEMLERHLRKSLRITANAENFDLDIHDELEQLRLEVKSLRDSQVGKTNNKERLTIEWLQQSVAELRKQLSELQQMANSAARDIRQRKESYEDLATIRTDFQQLKLELIALRERNEKNEVYVRELREELLQQEEDFKRMLHNFHKKQENNDNEDGSGERNVESDENENELTTESTADHKRRHCRFQRQQIHELQLTQRRMKHQIDELKFHRIDERVRNIEIEQHRIADANFNLSRQIASLDKLHSSMLELLEDVEGLQNKIDKNIPELRHEISKLEFSNAQLNSEQNLVREEGKNVARSVQAMAVSISTLQDEREGVKEMQNTVSQLQTNVDRLGSMMQDVQRALSHHRKMESKLQQHGNSKIVHAHHSTEQHQGHHHHSIKYTNNNNNNVNNENNDDIKGNEVSIQQDYAPMTQRAESLVAKLENVEQQYESIINKLPQDCSEVSVPNGAGSEGIDSSGLYLIAPAGQHRPMMAHCSSDGWTTVQRRYDGSADFNRSWEDYASGFGAPIGEYWIGNEQLHHLTLSNCTSLRVIMQDIYDNTWLAEYSYFYISSRADGYRLHIGGYHGNASDALDYQQGMQFSAIDVDRDISQTHCAANYEGGWWFSHCQHANLNGRYNLGLTWFDASRNEWIAVKSSQMLIKRHQTSESCSSILEASSASSAPSPTTIVSSNAAQKSQTTLSLSLPLLVTTSSV